MPPPAPAAASTLPTVSASVAACLPAPAAPEQATAPRRSRRLPTLAEADDPPRNLPTEADYNALVYPHRAREMRHYGGLPPDCNFGPPDDDLMRAIVTGTTPALRALDGPNATAA